MTSPLAYRVFEGERYFLASALLGPYASLSLFRSTWVYKTAKLNCHPEFFTPEGTWMHVAFEDEFVQYANARLRRPPEKMYRYHTTPQGAMYFNAEELDATSCGLDVVNHLLKTYKTTAKVPQITHEDKVWLHTAMLPAFQMWWEARQFQRFDQDLLQFLKQCLEPARSDPRMRDAFLDSLQQGPAANPAYMQWVVSEQLARVEHNLHLVYGAVLARGKRKC